MNNRLTGLEWMMLVFFGVAIALGTWAMITDKRTKGRADPAYPTCPPSKPR